MSRELQQAAISQLKKQSDLHGWAVRRIQHKEQQFYGVAEKADTQRQVLSDEVFVDVWVSQGQHVGLAGKLLSPEHDLESQLAELRAAAALQRNPIYELPKPAQPEPVKLFDPAIERLDLEQQATKVVQLVDSAGVELSSQEWFAGVAETELVTSTGFSGSHKNSRLTMELVLYRGEHERLLEKSYRRLDDLSLEELISHNAKIIDDLPKAKKPQAAKAAPVILSSEEFVSGAFGGGLLEPLTFHAGGPAAYQQLSRFKTGQPIVEAKGDRITLSSDPSYVFGTASYPFDNWGLVPKPVTFINDGQFTQTVADAKYAQYLEVEPTGGYGVLVLAPGKMAESELVKGAVYVETFSALDVDPLTGDFFGEIRVGYQYDQHGQAHPVRGGGVSGNLFDALKDCRLPKETVFQGNYQGPKSVRFEDVTISG